MKLRSIKYLITAFLFSVTLMVFFHKLPTYVNSQVDHVVISEIQIAGSSASDEFVELYNPTGSDIIMEGWRLSRKNSAGTQANLVANLNGTIPAHGFFLITHPDVEETYGADAIYSAASNALTNNFTVLLYSDTGITLVDKVGFGEPNDFETALISPAMTIPLSRTLSSISARLVASVACISFLFVISKPPFLYRFK